MVTAAVNAPVLESDASQQQNSTSGAGTLSPLQERLAVSPWLIPVRLVGAIALMVAPGGLLFGSFLAVRRYFSPEQRAKRAEQSFERLQKTGIYELGAESQAE